MGHQLHFFYECKCTYPQEEPLGRHVGKTHAAREGVPRDVQTSIGDVRVRVLDQIGHAHEKNGKGCGAKGHQSMRLGCFLIGHREKNFERQRAQLYHDGQHDVDAGAASRVVDNNAREGGVQKWENLMCVHAPQVREFVANICSTSARGVLGLTGSVHTFQMHPCILRYRMRRAVRTSRAPMAAC